MKNKVPFVNVEDLEVLVELFEHTEERIRKDSVLRVMAVDIDEDTIRMGVSPGADVNALLVRVPLARGLMNSYPRAFAIRSAAQMPLPFAFKPSDACPCH